MTYYAKKVDANHAEIVKALKKVGCCVMDLSGAGKGVMDILVFRGSRIWAVEIKDGSKPPSAQGLTPAQIIMHAKVAAAGGEIHIVRSVESALALVTNK